MPTNTGCPFSWASTTALTIAFSFSFLVRYTASFKVVELGGLKIIGTERHESRRIDNQLRGRAGRQGDPGESKAVQHFAALGVDYFTLLIVDLIILKEILTDAKVVILYLLLRFFNRTAYN